jgi:hypothetical protein
MSEEINRPQPANRNNTRIYIIVIALLLGLCIYLFVSRNKVEQQRETYEQQYTSADSSRNVIQGEYDAALARLDELVSKNAQMDSLLTDRNSEVSKLKKQIDAIVKNKNATAADLKKAQRLIAEMNSKVKTYEERIVELERENKDLTYQNVVVAKERDSAVTENIGLQQKVRLGAVLHASNIRMTPIDLKQGGKKQSQTGRASRVDIMRIKFDIDENRVAESGKKEVYLRISGPDGNLLSNAAYGSGVTTTADGKELNYTMMKQIDIEQGQPVKDVIVDWNQDSNYKKGNYNIELYHDGHKIGGGNVNLR